MAADAAPFAYLVRAVEYCRAAFPATLLPVAPDCTVLVSGAFLGLSVAAVASVTAADNRLTVRKARVCPHHTRPLAKPHCANTAHHRTSQARSRCAGAQPRAASGRLRSAQTARSSLRPATSSRPRTARRCARCSCVPHASPTRQPSRQTSALPRSWLFVPLSYHFFFFFVCVTPCWHRRQRSSTASCSGRCWSWSSVLPSRRRVCAAPSLVFLFLLLTEQSGCPHRDAEGAGEARGRGLRRSAKAQARSSSCCLVNISHPFHFFLSKQKNKKSTH